MTDDALALASQILPLYREAHWAYIQFCERGAKVLLLGVNELDIREFELSAARVEGTMIQLQEVVRRTWEAKLKMDEGLAQQAHPAVQRLKDAESRLRAEPGLPEPSSQHSRETGTEG